MSPQLQPEVESFARIKVIGIGGSGKNALNHMINSKVKGVEFIVMNTDTQDLHNSLADKKEKLSLKKIYYRSTAKNKKIFAQKKLQ